MFMRRAVASMPWLGWLLRHVRSYSGYRTQCLQLNVGRPGERLLLGIAFKLGLAVDPNRSTILRFRSAPILRVWSLSFCMFPEGGGQLGAP